MVDGFKLEAGNLLLQKKQIDVSELIDECIDTLYPLIADKEIVLEKNYQSGNLITADPLQLKRVFNNLLHNSIDCSPPLSKISIAIIHTENKNLCVRILDNGYGIAAEQLSNIFQSYSSSNKKFGNGLGLYIANLIVKAHGGTIIVNSERETGTSFQIKLPLES